MLFLPNQHLHHSTQQKRSRTVHLYPHQSHLPRVHPQVFHRWHRRVCHRLYHRIVLRWARLTNHRPSSHRQVHRLVHLDLEVLFLPNQHLHHSTQQKRSLTVHLYPHQSHLPRVHPQVFHRWHRRVYRPLYHRIVLRWARLMYHRPSSHRQVHRLVHLDSVVLFLPNQHLHHSTQQKRSPTVHLYHHQPHRRLNHRRDLLSWKAIHHHNHRRTAQRTLTVLHLRQHPHDRLLPVHHRTCRGHHRLSQL